MVAFCFGFHTKNKKREKFSYEKLLNTVITTKS